MALDQRETRRGIRVAALVRRSGVGTNLARSIRDTPRHSSARRREYNVKEETRTTEPPTRVKD
jgi:hypothetical protein